MTKDLILKIPYTEFKFDEYNRQINLNADFVKNVQYITEGWGYKCYYHYDQQKQILYIQKPEINLSFETIKITYLSKWQERDEKINNLL